jgi:cbb3-type cytochrome oxidase subunit 3
MAKQDECRVLEGSEETSYNATGLTAGSTYYWIVIPNDGGLDGTCSDGIRSFKVNSPPKITASLEDLRATTGTQFKLRLRVSDGDSEDAQNMKYSLVRSPEGMKIDNSGTIIWTPSSDQAGDRSVELSISDGVETVYYSFDINVVQGKGSSLPIVPLFLGIVLVIIVVAAVLFFALRKQKKIDEKKAENPVDDESAKIVAEMEAHKQGEDTMGLHAPNVVQTAVPMSVAEAHANLGKDRPKSYEELYGIPAPKQEEGLTTVELKEEIGKMADELENELAQE